MSFSAVDNDSLIPGSLWKYAESGNPYQPAGNNDYMLIEQSQRDIEDNRQGIQDLASGHIHNLRRYQILWWFIPFDKNFREGMVRLAVILAQLKISEVSAEDLQELLVRLEV